VVDLNRCVVDEFANQNQSSGEAISNGISLKTEENYGSLHYESALNERSGERSPSGETSSASGSCAMGEGYESACDMTPKRSAEHGMDETESESCSSHGELDGEYASSSQRDTIDGSLKAALESHLASKCDILTNLSANLTSSAETIDIVALVKSARNKDLVVTQNIPNNVLNTPPSMKETISMRVTTEISSANIHDGEEEVRCSNNRSQIKYSRPSLLTSRPHPSHPTEGIPGDPEMILSDPIRRQWRAKALRTTKLGSFLESAVKARLISAGFEATAASVSVRLVSNTQQRLDIPEQIRMNLRTPGGEQLPRSLPYKQKAVLLFQRVDGVDICLFSLYLHEFDAKCPPPNSSCCYIAYLDSVDYMRPMEARTLVYHEILVAYLKWSQARGFLRCHIWACPPQRGDNFIFWGHPPHQRTPSRDRLCHWYNRMLDRALRLGIIAPRGVSSLYAEHFSAYSRREASRKSVGSNRQIESLSNSTTPNDEDLFLNGNSEELQFDEIDEAPISPPIFEGDFWVTECSRLCRSVQQRLKGCDGQVSFVQIS
jgi:hypothetical protein